MIDRLSTEEAILANLMKNPDLFPKFKLRTDMFVDEDIRKIIDYIKDVGVVNPNEIYFKCRDDKDFVDVKRFTQISKSNGTDRMFFMDDQINLLDDYITRKAIEGSQNFLSNPSKKDFVYLLDELNSLKDITIEKSNKTDEFLSQVMESVLSDEPPQTIHTGFGKLDGLIHGFERGQLNVIAARPSMGKTGLALNTMWNIAKRGYEVSFFSLETTGDIVIKRMIAMIEAISLSDIKRPFELGTEKTSKVMEGINKIKQHKINIYDESHLTPSRIREQAAKPSDKPQVIFIDYLQLMESDAPTNDRRVDVEKISRDLKIIANETGCIIVLLSQLNRGVESRNDKRPMMSDLKESGGIEADASMIFMLYRDDYYNRDEAQQESSDMSELEVIVSKNKDGATGTVKFQYYKATQRFFT
ncbi:damage-inducible protein [Staphylococcus pseudintermedius]|uniref:Replicative DNA helicase n=1 Tax=Staphylococcus phage SpT152 TaxID=1913446 RepID=A0A1J0MF36_9CAUD|nr:DnaB helicase C-terminal domain-containing protein [Staphylococcus pseudintermedius]YP_010081921.1 DnaB-like replicative helicase [Staphylococcus phage SpT152]APD19837.1 replicative DNA helicase [Staphylococcus phage SpT152]EGQ0291595.1 AAA family ATPase [Staphylococcus pseudintermedius]EGQ1623575.1 damage-inducible protein [Staphylococcus pseudintermedius]EGQ1626595.1 damage-inducible protein [Staphylococcus pseudintermedius]EGQ1719269.1 damage-inducible protein [Staphylococcus pseudinter